MDLKRLTEKSQEALRNAQSLASRSSHQGIDVEHLLAALLADDSGLSVRILEKAGANPATVRERVAAALGKIPQVGDAGHDPEQIYVTQRLARLLEKAEGEAGGLKDEYVSVEHPVSYTHLRAHET